MRWYEPVEPSDQLARVLACSWTARPSGVHRLVPDGCIDLLWIDDGQLVLCGPETTAWTFSLPPGTTAAGVRFRPGVAPAILDFDASVLLNRRSGIRAMIGERRHDTLTHTLSQGQGSDDQRRILEAFVGEQSAGVTFDTSIAEAVVERVVAHPRVTTAAIADIVGLTPRQLQRKALVSFGYGVKTLSRLVRFQRFLAIIEAGFASSLALAAAEAGYADHAHLTRDCRTITGRTPRDFLSDYWPTFPDMSDPFKTAAPLAAKVRA